MAGLSMCPLAGSWRLSDATPAQRANWRLSETAMASIGQMSMKTSARKGCSTALQFGDQHSGLAHRNPDRLPDGCSRNGQTKSVRARLTTEMVIDLMSGAALFCGHRLGPLLKYCFGAARTATASLLTSDASDRIRINATRAHAQSR